MRTLSTRLWKQAAVVALVAAADLLASLPIMGSVCRPFSWMAITPADATTLYPIVEKPRIRLSTLLLKAAGTEGRVPPNGRFSLANGGPDTLRWRASTESPWLDLVPSKGSSTGEWDEVAVVYRTDALRYGVHTASVVLASDQATNSPQILTVVLNQRPGRPPPAPRLRFPGAAARLPFTNRVTFAWSPAPRAERYTVFIGKDGAPFLTRTVKGETTTNLTVEAPFRAGVYTWMALGRNGMGESPWSTTVTFRVSERLLEPGGNLRLPPDAAPAFRWQETVGADAYEVRLSRYAAPSNPLTTANANGHWIVAYTGPAAAGEDGAWSPPGLAFPPAPYRWQVREHEGGAWAPWSKTAPFRIAVPDVPKPLAPAGATVRARPAFRWTPPDGAEPLGCEIRIRLDNRIRKVYTHEGPPPFVPPPEAPLPTGALTWQLRAFESGPNGERRFGAWSAETAFTVR